jgi:hypothetical protein
MQAMIFTSIPNTRFRRCARDINAGHCRNGRGLEHVTRRERGVKSGHGLKFFLADGGR